MEKTRNDIDIRLSEPFFTPLRAKVKSKPKVKRRPMTTRKKQRIDPTYKSPTLSDKEKQERIDYWIDKKHIKNETKRKLLATNVRYKNDYMRGVGGPHYKKLGLVKKCTRCKIIKPYCMFDRDRGNDKAKNNKAIPRKPYCYLCRKKINAAYYDKNKQRLIDKAKQRYAENTEEIKQKFKENYERRTRGHLTKEC